MCFTGDADVTNVENIFAIWRRVRLSWVIASPPPPQTPTAARQILADILQIPKRERRHPRKHNEMCHFSRGSPERACYEEQDRQLPPHLLDKNGTGGRKLFLGTMPIALLATRAPWKKGGRKRKRFLAASHSGERERERLIVSGGRADPSISSGCARETIKRMIRLQKREAVPRAL